jgi:hypothetical protein
VEQGVETDPPPDGSDAVCHTDWPVRPRRFTAVAVSKGEHSLKLSDNSPDFFQYVLVDEYADWPQMSVGGDFLILNHRDSASNTNVFDAKSLASGTDAGTVMKVKPLAILSSQDLTDTLHSPLFPHESATEFSGDSGVRMLPVNTHDDSGGLTFLVGGYASLLFVFAIEAGAGTTKPRLLDAVQVPLGFDYAHPQCNAVYQGGHLFLTFAQADESIVAKSFDRHSTRVIRVRVGRGPDPTALAADGLWEHTFGGGDKDILSYLNPCIEVTRRGDVVVAYNRVGLRAALASASARYSVMVTGESEFRPSISLHDGGALSPGVSVWNPSANTHTGGPQGLDLPGMAPDPKSEHAVWVAHGFGTGTPDAADPTLSSGLASVVAKIETA